uniref:Uncharacterized protein n=1 Tax=Anguilla anguilla TaxID=7936 RepID=A0A0E9W2U9_ANGAN
MLNNCGEMQPRHSTSLFFLRWVTFNQ